MNRSNAAFSHRVPARAFTIPEMLAVVAIIVIILSILLPSLWHGREYSREVMCKSNQRQIGIAFMSYAKDTLNSLPANTNGELDGDWLGYATGGSADQKWAASPQTGSIFPYVNKRPELYLCPTLPKGVLGSGVGSNGRFDITAFAAFGGAKTFNISSQSRVNIGGTYMDIITPIIIEEDPKELNGGNREGHFGNVDLFGQWHHDGGSFAAIDGSVQRVDYPSDVQVFALHFESKPRGGAGNWMQIGQSGGWGWWNLQ
jgi:prepilin-type N-terminal cleavage/methylation domain-containing protein